MSVAELIRRGDHHDRRQRTACLIAELLGGREAVHARHVHVEQDEIERAAAALGIEHGVERGEAALDERRHHLPLLERLLKDSTVRDVVVGDEHQTAHELRRDRRRRVFGADFDLNREMKCTAAVRLAVDPDTPAHHRDKTGRDREAEAGTAKAARRRAVGLAEGVENHPLFVGRDADAGVGHGHVHNGFAGGLRMARDAYDDFAFIGELDGVADQIQQNLTESPDVGDEDVRHVWRHFAQQLEVLLVSTDRQARQRIVERVAQLELCGIQVETSCFDLGEVEDVIDDQQERFGRRAHEAELLALFRRERRVERQIRHADDPVHRRSDFVAHVGEELALRPAGFFRAVFRDHQLAIDRRQLPRA